MFSSLQLAILALTAAYLLRRRAALWSRNRATWAALVEKLSIDRRNDGAELDGQFTSDGIRLRAAMPEGRRGMFREAGVMLEMADYAERNSMGQGSPVIVRLRDHALWIRIATAKDAMPLWRWLKDR